MSARSLADWARLGSEAECEDRAMRGGGAWVRGHDTMVAAADLRRVVDQLVQVGLETLDHAVHNAQFRKKDGRP